jgi:hypothetical protein
MKTIAQQINWDFKTNGKLVIKDKKGNRIYFELADGFWARYEYDSKGKQIYFENSSGVWAKWEFDFQGNVIYFENSDFKIVDNRPRPSEDSVVEIDDVKHKLTKP